MLTPKRKQDAFHAIRMHAVLGANCVAEGNNAQLNSILEDIVHAATKLSRDLEAIPEPLVG